MCVYVNLQLGKVAALGLLPLGVSRLTVHWAGLKGVRCSQGWMGVKQDLRWQRVLKKQPSQEAASVRQPLQLGRTRAV